MPKTMLPMDLTYAQVFMDQLTSAVVAGDVDTYLRMTDFPFCAVWATKSICLQDEAAGREHCTSVTRMYRALGIVTVYRLVTRIDMISDISCMVDYLVTLVTQSGTRHCAPYRGISVLRRTAEGDWKTASTISSLENKEWPMASPQPPRQPGHTVASQGRKEQK